MRKNTLSKKFPLTLPQLFLAIVGVVALFIVIGLNRYDENHEAVAAGEATFQAEVDAEITRQVELQATLTYVESATYVEHYFRNEENMVLEGENRIVPNVIPVTPTPASVQSEAGTPGQVSPAQPWQMWWRLISDAPFPAR
jgi:hypothetical protein